MFTMFRSFDTAPVSYLEGAGDRRVLRIPLAGFAPEEVEVRVVGQELRVAASRAGSVVIARRYSLPVGVDRDAVQASMLNGLLTVELSRNSYERVVPVALAESATAAAALQAPTGDE